MILSSYGISASQGKNPPLLLNLYPGAAAAYSVRKINNAYLGKAIRVRRSSDNSELDIGFDSNNNLDESALTSFVGANNGFITKWYDQTGNYDMSQSRALFQPRIVSAGTIDKVNGKPALYFDGNGDNLFNDNENLSYVFLLNPFLLNMVIRPTNINGGSNFGFNKRILHSFVNYGNTIQLVINEGGLDKADAPGQSARSASAGQFFTLSQTLFTFNTPEGIVYSNNVQKNTGTSGAGSPGPWFTNTILGACGQDTGINGPYVGNIQEVLLYPGNQTSNRLAIAANINSYFSIF